MLRSLFVFTIVIIGFRYAFQAPFYGLLLYLWLAYFRPEQWVWTDLVAQLNLSFLAGILLLVRTAFSDEKLKLTGRSRLLFVFAAHCLVSTMLSAYPDWVAWQNFTKSIIITFLLINLATDVTRYRMILVVIGLSLGAEATKQGWAQMFINPGGRNDNTIPFLGDNNAVAVGMMMLVPILIALARTATTQWERRLFQFMTIGVTYRGIVTYSRGGFLTAGAVVLAYILRSRQRVRTLVGILVLAALIQPLLPDEFWNRMQTIAMPQEQENEPPKEEDSSARSRMHFWRVAMVMAAANPLFGVGHNAYNWHYDQYDFSNGLYGHWRSVHSVWFGVMAELGYLGFFLYVLQLVLALFACRRVRRAARRNPAIGHLEHYALAHEVSLVAFAVGGTFVPLAFNEFFWHIVGLTIALEKLAIPTAAEQPAEIVRARRAIVTAAAGPAIAPRPAQST